MPSIYSPYNGVRKIETFYLGQSGDKCLYENLLNDPKITVIKEEFIYAGREKDNPVITIWYEESE
jgi:hypothetical protein